MSEIALVPEYPQIELIGWQNPYLMLGNAMQFYVREHTV